LIEGPQPYAQPDRLNGLTLSLEVFLRV
jgi:hypothetical protein